jgi:hypothetical protein
MENFDVNFYRRALLRIKQALGVPNEDYPAPVANAWAIADAALHFKDWESEPIAEPAR